MLAQLIRSEVPILQGPKLVIFANLVKVLICEAKDGSPSDSRNGLPLGPKGDSSLASKKGLLLLRMTCSYF